MSAKRDKTPAQPRAAAAPEAAPPADRDASAERNMASGASDASASGDWKPILHKPYTAAEDVRALRELFAFVDADVLRHLPLKTRQQLEEKMGDFKKRMVQSESEEERARAERAEQKIRQLSQPKLSDCEFNQVPLVRDLCSAIWTLRPCNERYADMTEDALPRLKEVTETPYRPPFLARKSDWKQYQKTSDLCYQRKQGGQGKKRSRISMDFNSVELRKFSPDDGEREMQQCLKADSVKPFLLRMRAFVFSSKFTCAGISGRPSGSACSRSLVFDTLETDVSLEDWDFDHLFPVKHFAFVFSALLKIAKDREKRLKDQAKFLDAAYEFMRHLCYGVVVHPEFGWPPNGFFRCSSCDADTSNALGGNDHPRVTEAAFASLPPESVQPARPSSPTLASAEQKAEEDSDDLGVAPPELESIESGGESLRNPRRESLGAQRSATPFVSPAKPRAVANKPDPREKTPKASKPNKQGALTRPV
jgi:hypothetical protein